MYAIFQAKGKQFRAEPDMTIRMPSLDAEPGERVTFEEVLLAERDGEVLVGRPSLDGASVAAEVIRHGKGKKIVVFKMKRRKNYRRKQGHRQPFTEVRVVDIEVGTATAPAPAAADEAPPAPEPAAEESAGEEPSAAAEEAAGGAVIPEDVEITPAARKLAEEHGIDVTAMEGTGKDGRILKSDVKQAVREQSDE